MTFDIHHGDALEELRKGIMPPPKAKMKVLSIRQPFAGMIAIGMKKIENRIWRCSYRGPLAIHASQKWHPSFGPPTVDAQKIVTLRGCVIAVAVLSEIITPEEALRRYPDQREYIEGPWCWVLGDVRKVPPYPCQGQLGIFEIDRDN
ncbi:hypothetical protein ES703_36820 [subsurface metagenome]